MSKHKIRRFAEMDTFDRVFQPKFEEIFNREYFLRGKWQREVFGNNNPLVLELGCGKGEYTVGLAREYKSRNFIGVDIKGARIWKGAKISNQENITNSAFLRTRIEFIHSFFAPGEVEEIWLTFPDPQMKRRRSKKRLCGSLFLQKYQSFLTDGGIIHLKTDNKMLFGYTLALAQENELEILAATDNLYASVYKTTVPYIHTYYEQQYLAQSMPVHYLKFRLPHEKIICEPSWKEE